LSNHASFYLGNRTLQTFGPTLPFLFKVLSVEKALSIQAHPSKDLASQLHISKPDLYKDGNHKPEIALPITRFEALCGFRSTTQVAEFVKRVPELAACANHVSTGAPFDLRRGFENLMRQSEEIISKNVAHLVQRLQNQDPATRSAEDELVLRLHAQYGNDVGVLCVYFLNYVTVEPGTFIYCAPNEPHAYLSGECVECMACSDNVVRAGLTPKPKDVDTLLRMLTYRDDLCGELISTGKKVADGIELYDPPVPEFKVLSVKLGSSGPRKIVLDGPAIVAALMDVSGGDMVVTASEPALNEKQALAKGGVYFVRSGVELTFAPGQGHVYVATC
jgi:mannose-6-phosphate isomerase